MRLAPVLLALPTAARAAVDQGMFEVEPGGAGSGWGNAPGAFVAGAAIGALAGFIFAIATGRSETACAALAAPIGGAILVALAP